MPPLPKETVRLRNLYNHWMMAANQKIAVLQNFYHDEFDDIMKTAPFSADLYKVVCALEQHGQIYADMATSTRIEEFTGIKGIPSNTYIRINDVIQLHSNEDIPLFVSNLDMDDCTRVGDGNTWCAKLVMFHT